MVPPGCMRAGRDAVTWTGGKSAGSGGGVHASSSGATSSSPASEHAITRMVWGTPARSPSTGTRVCTRSYSRTAGTRQVRVPSENSRSIRAGTLTSTATRAVSGTQPLGLA